MKKIKILLDDNKRIVSYCDFGELENSIEIEVDDNFCFDANKIYSYVDGKLEYTVNLDELKAQKIEELKMIRDEKISENLEYDGACYQVRNEDIQKFLLKILEHELMPESNVKEVWRLANNTYKEITFDDIKNILKVYGDRQREIFNTFYVLDKKLEIAKSVEEIESIKWE